MSWNKFAAPLALLVVASAGQKAFAQSPSFALSFDAPAFQEGPAGTSVAYEAVGKLTTSGLASADPGAQGWSLSMAAEGGSIVSVTTAGTDAAVIFDSGFNKTQLTTGAGNEGAVSAVVLSLLNPVTLPPMGSASIIRLTVEATAPEPLVDPAGDPSCEPLLSRVSFVDGRTGSGQPVDNKVTYRGQTVLPALSSAETSICPTVVKPLNLRVTVESGQATGPKAGGKVPWEVQVAVGTPSVEVACGVLLESRLPDDSGAQGWSISVRTDPCFNIAFVTTAGTDVPLYFSGGFNKTELVDPALNGDEEGAVSAVVLSLTEGNELPPVSDVSILRVRGSMDSSSILGPGDATGGCSVVVTHPSEAGLRGSGQPVRSAVTVAGETRLPGVCGASISLVAARQGRFIRGNANNDLKNDIADSVWIVNELFRSGSPTRCQDAADANDDGRRDLADAVFLIEYQFVGGAPPPSPFPACGVDPDADDDGLSCEETQIDC